MSRFTRFVPPAATSAAASAANRVRVSVEARPGWKHSKLRLLIGAELAAKAGLEVGKFVVISHADEKGRLIVLVEEAAELDQGAIRIAATPGQQGADETAITRMIAISGLPGLPAGKRAAVLVEHKQVEEGIIITLPDWGRVSPKAAKAEEPVPNRHPHPQGRPAPLSPHAKPLSHLEEAIRMATEATGLHGSTFSSDAKLSPGQRQMRDLVLCAMLDAGVERHVLLRRLGVAEAQVGPAEVMCKRLIGDNDRLARIYKTIRKDVSALAERVAS